MRLIADVIRSGSRVLDVGCGDGKLLDYLVHHKQVDGRGIELSQAGVNACVAGGLSVIQGDADTDLRDYPSDSFDYVVLGQTIQATRDPYNVLREMLRIGRHAIVSIRNAGYWRTRLQLLLTGRMPVTDATAEAWYDNSDIHMCTIADFVGLCRDLGARIEHAYILNGGKPLRAVGPMSGLGNFLGREALFMLSRE
ncbi:MAG: methionine biosynthesis protein MetW [Alphaproteobacteria bacterium]